MSGREERKKKIIEKEENQRPFYDLNRPERNKEGEEDNKKRRKYPLGW